MFFESKDCMKGGNNTITLCDNFIFFKTDKQLASSFIKVGFGETCFFKAKID
nr:hypothetical protein Mb_orf140 [Mamestra brassicae multiple nucleopolyhedrovirus]